MHFGGFFFKEKKKSFKVVLSGTKVVFFWSAFYENWYSRKIGDTALPHPLLIPPVLLIPSSSSETCDSMAHKKATDKVHQAKKQAAAKANSKKNLVYTGFGHA